MNETKANSKVKRSVLSEFIIKIKSGGDVVLNGEVISAYSNETQKFNDINDMLRIIERQCNAVSYPQSQRKLSEWTNESNR